MEKIRLTRVSIVENLPYLRKYTTQVNNVFIYDVQIGQQYKTRIFNDQKDIQSPRFGEKSVVVIFSDYDEERGPYGITEYIGYTDGLKRKYDVHPGGVRLLSIKRKRRK